MQKQYNRIDNIKGNIIEVRAKDVGLNELAQVIQGNGESSLADVIGFRGDRVSLQVFAGTRGVSTGDTVRFLSRPMQAPFGASLLGRRFNGAGAPIDDGPEIMEDTVEIAGPPFNPTMRVIPRQMIRTNIPAIDVFNTLVKSQKIPIFSIPGEPYNPLLARIAAQTDADIVILGGMGLKYDDYEFFRRNFEETGAIERSVMFIHLASDPVVENLLVPDLALAVAEQFALQDKGVLVLLTDMTNFADALKEIAISMDRIPSNRSYPGSLYSDLAARYEKAVDIEGSGAITLISVTTMPGNDVTHPVPDNTGYITEGQFYLHDRHIDPFGSLSRLKQQVIGRSTREDHGEIMNTCIRLYSDAQQSMRKHDMGFRLSTWDRKLIDYAASFRREVLDLSVNIGLEDALDLCWSILARFFEPDEVAMKRELVDKYWKVEAVR
ncbi:V-type sodium ATPase subunit B [subsurface metagenome]